MSHSTSSPPRSNWQISQRTNASTTLYALAILDISATDPSQSDSLASDIGNKTQVGIGAFGFNCNPKSMNLEEPAAVTITPTQNGGQFIEHQGQIYKNIRLNGTTGMRPNRNTSGGIIPIAGVLNPLFGTNVDPATNLPVGERTGFDDLIDLRNLFRIYWDMKEDPQYASTTIMVWQNGKEGEYYVVEPMTFTTSRDASSPLTFTYDIVLRTIERLDVRNLKSSSDTYLKRNGVDTFFQRVSDIRAKLIQGYQLASAYVDRAVSIGQAAITNVLAPLNDVIQALTGVITSGTRIFNIPRNSLAVLATNSMELATAFDSLAVAYNTDGASDQLENVAHAYKIITRAVNALSSETQLYSAPMSTTISAKQKAYQDPVIGAPKSGGSPTYLGNQRSTNSAGISNVFGGENIYGAAQRLLGDSAKWKILVLLNQLKAPYISVAGDGVNVLRPGDQILYPVSQTTPQSAIQPTEQKYTGISPLNNRLGCDLMLVANQGAGGEVLYDLAISPSGDLQTVLGMANMQQAIVTKFDIEQGELPTHPQFGIKFPIGTKGTVQSVVGFQVNARATLLSDSRISTVDQLQVGASGNVLNLTSTVTLKGADESLSLDFSVTR